MGPGITGFSCNLWTGSTLMHLRSTQGEGPGKLSISNESVSNGTVRTEAIKIHWPGLTPRLSHSQAMGLRTPPVTSVPHFLSYEMEM